MNKLFRRLGYELGLAWCWTAHGLSELRFIVHDRVGIVKVCRRCRRIHL